MGTVLLYSRFQVSYCDRSVKFEFNEKSYCMYTKNDSERKRYISTYRSDQNLKFFFFQFICF